MKARRGAVAGVSPYAGKAEAKVTAAEARARDAKAAQREAESRADAADCRAERLEAALERIGERLDAIERRLERKAEVKPKAVERAAVGRVEVTQQSGALDGMLLHGMQAIADHLGVPRRVAYYMADTGQIPTFRMGRTRCAERSLLTAEIRSRAARLAEPFK